MCLVNVRRFTNVLVRIDNLPNDGDDDGDGDGFGIHFIASEMSNDYDRSTGTE